MAYWDNVRRRRNEMRAARGAEPLPERRRSTGGADEDAPPAWDEMPGREEARGDEDHLQALQERESELGEATRLIGELKDYAEQLERRIAELIAGATPMVKALLLPGVKTFLLTKFHPDKYPEADERQRALLTEATQIITAAYALADELHASE